MKFLERLKTPKLNVMKQEKIQIHIKKYFRRYFIFLILFFPS
ncbi:hypothetical protein STRDD11_01397 [Streptococcus sp. DD11]|nr:hypothetical protein STRDD11_01397 [Streptococcus sp. DD11]